MRRHIALTISAVLVTILLSGCGGSISEAEKRFNTGTTFQEQGNLQEAIAQLNEADGLIAQLARTYYSRGLVYGNLDQYERAIEEFDEAIRLDPQFAFSYYNRARAYIMAGKDVEAQRDVELAIELGIDRSVVEEEIERLKQLR